MEAKYLKKNERGIVAVIPLLLVGSLVALVVVFRDYQKNNLSSPDSLPEVLSEFEDGDELSSEIRQVEEILKESEDKNKELEDQIRELESEPDDDVSQDVDDVRDNDDRDNGNEVENENEDEDVTEQSKRNKQADVEKVEATPFAQGNLPVAVNLQTNELTVKTTSGERVLPVVPEKAVEEVVKSGIFDYGAVVEVRERGKELEYEVEGIDEKKLFGLFRILVKKRARVSALDGQVIKVDQPLWSRIVDKVSF